MEIDNFLPGSAALIDMVDKPLLVHLRDGRTLQGILRSYDQFANLVIHDTSQVIDDTKCHIGTLLIRGENVVFIGELEEFEEGIDSDELIQQWKTRQNEMLLKRKEKNEILKSLGFCVESVEGDAY